MTMELQKEHLSLSDCRIAVDTLFQAVSRGKGLLGNPYYQTKFKDAAINLHGRHSPDADFESGLIKIQRSQAH